MGTILILLGVIFIIMSLLLLFVTPAAIIFTLVGIYVVYYGTKMNKTKKLKKNTVENQETNQESTEPIIKSKVGSLNKSESKTNVKHYTFRVAGITKTNDKREDIQKLIGEYVKDQLDPDEAYEGLSNKEILEDYYDDKVYEISDLFLGTDEVTLEFEPDNPFDSNAIKVISEDLGHIGYVPKDNNIEVAEIIKNKEYHLTSEIIGGKYKYVDPDEDKVKIEKDFYGIEIKISYE